MYLLVRSIWYYFLVCSTSDSCNIFCSHLSLSHSLFLLFLSCILDLIVSELDCHRWLKVVHSEDGLFSLAVTQERLLPNQSGPLRLSTTFTYFLIHQHTHAHTEFTWFAKNHSHCYSKMHVLSGCWSWFWTYSDGMSSILIP